MDSPKFKLRRSASYPLVQASMDCGKNSSLINRATNTRSDLRQPSANRLYSLRDINEQVSALRKENFNLKLDLFLLRERYCIDGSRNGEGNDVVSYKIELERLRKELREKTAIIKEALDGIRYIENIEDEIERKYEIKVEVLQQKIQYLEESNAEKLRKILKLSSKVEESQKYY